MSKSLKKKDSWSTTSSEASSSLSKSNSSLDKSESYSNFSSESEDELKKNSTDNSNQSFPKNEKRSKENSNKSLSSFKSLSNESLSSCQSDEFKLPQEDLPLNVLQLLLSIRESEINVKNLKLKHEENLQLLKSELNPAELEQENETLSDTLLRESIELISLNSVIYGEHHLKLAWAHVNLALVYLECQNLPKQAKHHCENAFRIHVEHLKATGEVELEPNDQRHQMVLNFVYGRSCTLLKE